MPKVDVELNQPVEVQTVWVLTRDLCRVSSCELDVVPKWNPFLSSELLPSGEVGGHKTPFSFCSGEAGKRVCGHAA